MLFAERWIRYLLILHAIVAAGLVGAATHHLLASRRYLQGRFDKLRVERLYALVTATLFVLTFFGGAMLYPVYKVRVRAEYFDAPQAVAEELKLRSEQSTRAGSPPTGALLGELSWAGRLFDIKEHWAALGCFASLALLLLSRRAHPSEDRRFVAVYVGLSAVVCATAWIGAIVGLVTASLRSVGGVS